MCGNPFHLLQAHEIFLSTESYDASSSRMEITLKPKDEDVWKGSMAIPVSAVKFCIMQSVKCLGS